MPACPSPGRLQVPRGSLFPRPPSFSRNWPRSRGDERPRTPAAPLAAASAAPQLHQRPAAAQHEPLGGAALVEPRARQQPRAPIQEQTPLIAHELLRGALAARQASAGPEGRPPPTVLLVHGILGNRRNMQGFARRLLAGFPQWQVLLVDLRCHGESATAPLGGPHSVAAAAGDVLHLLAALRLFPEVLIGHSFGGKVVLSMWEQFAHSAKRMPKNVKMWVLDALPGPDPLGAGGGGACSPPAGSADPAARPEALMAALRTAPLPTTHRRFVTAHLERAGFPPHVAAWAAQNLAPDGRGRLCWGFDLDGIEQMYSSFKESSHWDALGRAVEGFSLGFVRAERSAFDWGEAEERIRSLGHSVHTLPNSAHWVHTDNPDGLFDILAPSFGAGEAAAGLQQQPAWPASWAQQQQQQHGGSQEMQQQQQHGGSQEMQPQRRLEGAAAGALEGLLAGHLNSAVAYRASDGSPSY